MGNLVSGHGQRAGEKELKAGQDKQLLTGKAMTLCGDSILVPSGNALAVVINLDQTLSR